MYRLIIHGSENWDFKFMTAGSALNCAANASANSVVSRIILHNITTDYCLIDFVVNRRKTP